MRRTEYLKKGLKTAAEALFSCAIFENVKAWRVWSTRSAHDEKKQYDWRKPCSEGVICHNCGHMNKPDDDDDYYNERGMHTPGIICRACEADVSFEFFRTIDTTEWQTVQDEEARS